MIGQVLLPPGMTALSGTSAKPSRLDGAGETADNFDGSRSALATPIANPLPRAMASSLARAASIASGPCRRIEDNVGARGSKLLPGCECHGEAPCGCSVIDVKQSARGDLTQDRRQRPFIRGELAAKKIRDAA